MTTEDRRRLVGWSGAMVVSGGLWFLIYRAAEAVVRWFG